MANFNDLLNVDGDSIERPKPLPVGTYTLVVGEHKFGESSQKGTPFVEFAFNVISPGEDISPDMLADVKWQNREIRRQFYLTSDAMFMLKEFLENCGIKMTGMKLIDALPLAKGQMILGKVTQRPATDDSGRIFSELKSFVKAS